MKYKADDVVVLKNRHDVFGNGNAVKIDYTNSTIGRYYSEGVVNGGFDDKDIDDEMTAEYNNKNNSLEKIVAVKNQVNKKKALKHYQEQLDAIGAVTNAIQPNHYKKNGKDLIDIWKDMFDEKEFRAVMKSNIMRYTVRYEEKNWTEDLFKIIEYTERLIEWEESLE